MVLGRARAFLCPALATPTVRHCCVHVCQAIRAPLSTTRARARTPARAVSYLAQQTLSGRPNVLVSRATRAVLSLRELRTTARVPSPHALPTLLVLPTVPAALDSTARSLLLEEHGLELVLSLRAHSMPQARRVARALPASRVHCLSAVERGLVPAASRPVLSMPRVPPPARATLAMVALSLSLRAPGRARALYLPAQQTQPVPPHAAALRATRDLYLLAAGRGSVHVVLCHALPTQLVRHLAHAARAIQARSPSLVGRGRARALL